MFFICLGVAARADVATCQHKDLLGNTTPCKDINQYKPGLWMSTCNMPCDSC